MTTVARLPDQAWLVALSSLPQMGPRRLRSLLATDAAACWWDHLTGSASHRIEWPAPVLEGGTRLVDAWREAARRIDPTALWAAHLDAGLTVLTAASDDWPATFADDREPPALLFGSGRVSALAFPCVAIVGTRRCTRAGARVARTIGRDLADSGVSVVSGLALGIDGAAHVGALEVEVAPPIGVVGNGLDVVYPRSHADLYSQVSSRGLLLSEHPLGVDPKTWSFPARNRIVAALAEVVVVVESHQAGGSQYTVDEAIERDTAVAAVPGSVFNRASSGTNRLLVDGVATAVCDASDVLALLGWGRTGSADDPATEPDDEVLAAVGFEPTSFEQIVVRTGLALGLVHERLDGLAHGGWVVEQSGWWERSNPDGRTET